jgi:hypothetical protein
MPQLCPLVLRHCAAIDRPISVDEAPNVRPTPNSPNPIHRRTSHFEDRLRNQSRAPHMVRAMMDPATPWPRVLDRVLIAMRLVLAVIFGLPAPRTPQLPEPNRTRRKRRKAPAKKAKRTRRRRRRLPRS